MFNMVMDRLMLQRLLSRHVAWQITSTHQNTGHNKQKCGKHLTTYADDEDD